MKVIKLAFYLGFIFMLSLIALQSTWTCSFIFCEEKYAQIICTVKFPKSETKHSSGRAAKIGEHIVMYILKSSKLTTHFCLLINYLDNAILRKP